EPKRREGSQCLGSPQSTGLRQGELLALRWRDVDLDAETLAVRATLQHTPDGWDFAEPKTGRSRRQVELTKGAVDALRRHRARQLEERLAQPFTASSYRT